MQLRTARFARRLLAGSAAVWLVVFGALGARHEARVAHVTDAFTGALVHAGPSACHDHQAQTHIDRAPASGDHDACELLGVLHQSAAPSVAWAGIHLVAITPLEHARLSSALALRSHALYRVAPKTSPPA